MAAYVEGDVIYIPRRLLNRSDVVRTSTVLAVNTHQRFADFIFDDYAYIACFEELDAAADRARRLSEE